MPNHPHSLSRKLSIGYLLLVVPIFVASLGLLFILSRDAIRSEARDHAANALDATMQRANSYLHTIETATNSNDWLILDDLTPDALLALTRHIVQLNQNVNGCSITMEPYIFPQYGRYFSAYTVREGDTITTVREGEYDYFGKVWYKTPKTQGRACWVEPFDDYNEGTLSSSESIASYCKPLYRPDSTLVGVISTDVSLRKLAEAIADYKPYPHAYYIMIGHAGHYFIHPDSTRLFHQTIFDTAKSSGQADIITLGKQMTAGKQGYKSIVMDDGIPCLVCYQQVPGTQWSLALVCPDSDILKNNSKLELIVIMIAIGGLLVILLLSRRAVRHAMNPIWELVGRTQQIADGHYDMQIPHSPRADVIGQLQNSFTVMQQSLWHHVSDIEQANIQTRQSNEELERTTQLAEKASQQKVAFIQNMTHQIRTPLNIIMGFAQIVRDSLSMLSEDEARSITDMMDHNAKTLNRMVLMLFDSSDSGQSLELSNKNQQELVSCNAVAQESIEHTRLHFPQLPINFQTTVPDTLRLLTNRLYLMRSLREILYNAAKYSDGQHVALHIEQTASTVRFIFEDTGPGMPAEYQEMMFRPFTKVNDLSEGLGLGLPLAKRHIQNLGGELTLDPSYHAGCRFIVELHK